MQPTRTNQPNHIDNRIEIDEIDMFINQTSVNEEANIQNYIDLNNKKIKHGQQLKFFKESEETNIIPNGLMVKVKSNLPLPNHLLDLWKEKEHEASWALINVCKTFHREELLKTQSEINELKKVLPDDKIKQLNTEIINQQRSTKNQQSHQGQQTTPKHPRQQVQHTNHQYSNQQHHHTAHQYQQRTPKRPQQQSNHNGYHNGFNGYKKQRQ